MAEIPADTTRLLYATCNGNQYLDTTINLKNYSYFKLTFDLSSNYNDWNGFFTNTSNNSRGGGYIVPNYEGFHFRYNNTTISENIKIKGRYELSFEFDNGVMRQYHDGVMSPEVKNVNQITINDVLRLFKNWNTSFRGDIYRVTFNDGTADVLDIVPAIKNDVVGFFDFVSGDFLTPHGKLIAGPAFEDATINVAVIGEGTVTVPSNLHVGETATLTAEPADSYIFGNWKNGDGEIVSTSREYTFVIPSANVQLTAKFVNENLQQEVLSRRFKLYRSRGNTLTRRDDDIYVTDVTLNIPRVIQSFKDFPGSQYATIEGVSGYKINASGAAVFDGFISNYDKLGTTLVDSSYIGEFYNDLIYQCFTGNPSAAGINYRLVDEETGYYLTICFAEVSNFGNGDFYRNDDTRIAHYRAILSRDWAQSKVLFRTFGFTGYLDGEPDELSGIYLIQAEGTGQFKNLIIPSNKEGNITATEDVTEWFNAVKVPEEPVGPDPYNPSTPIEDLPSDTIEDTKPTGFMEYGDTHINKVFIPSEQQLQDFADVLFGSSFLENIAYNTLNINFNDIVLALNVMPFSITADGSKFVKVGWWTTGVSMNYTNRLFYEFDCGEITVPAIYGNALDYYADVQIYLPFLDYKHLETFDVIGKRIHPVYQVDLISGDCVVKIFIDGTCKYQFTGNVGYSLSISQMNNLNIGLKPIASIAGSAASFNADRNVQRDVQTTTKLNWSKGEERHVTSTKQTTHSEQVVERTPGQKFDEAIGTFTNMGGGVSRGGNLSGNSGFLSINTPHIIITRPNVSSPENFGHLYGFPCNKYLSLGDLHGYTEVAAEHLEGIICTSTELDEIDRLLKEGVIL